MADSKVFSVAQNSHTPSGGSKRPFFLISGVLIALFAVGIGVYVVNSTQNIATPASAPTSYSSDSACSQDGGSIVSDPAQCPQDRSTAIPIISSSGPQSGGSGGSASQPGSGASAGSGDSQSPGQDAGSGNATSGISYCCRNLSVPVDNLPTDIPVVTDPPQDIPAVTNPPVTSPPVVTDPPVIGEPSDPPPVISCPVIDLDFNVSVTCEVCSQSTQ